MKICWASNYYQQPTGYGRVAANTMHHIAHNSKHEVVHYAVSGLERVTTHEEDGIKVYSRTNWGDKLGYRDMPVVQKIEQPDVWMMNYDAWFIDGFFANCPLDYVTYAPIDHDPLSVKWYHVFENALEIIPYCKFGRRVIEDRYKDMDKVQQPIYHGVDTESFYPIPEANKKEVFGVDNDTFVIGYFKNNQGTRLKVVRHLVAFKHFLEWLPDDAKAMLYIHSADQGNNGFPILFMAEQIGVKDNVLITNSDQYRYGLQDDQLNMLYNGCDVVANVTAGEGFGLPIVEGLACGTPPIVGGYSSMAELIGLPEGELNRKLNYDELESLVKTNPSDSDFIDAPESNLHKPFVEGKYGLAIPVWDREPTQGKLTWRRTFKAEHMAKAFLWAYENQDKMQEMGEAGHEWVQQYDWSNIADEWIDYFDALEGRMYKEDREGLQLKKITKETGGVGALGRGS